MRGPDENRRGAIGVLVTIVASSLMPFADDTTPLIPIPIHNFLLYSFVSWGYLIFLPAVFAASYWLLRGRPSTRVLTLAIALSVAALDAVWIVTHWALGLDYPGAAFVLAVAFENALAFAVVIALAIVGVARRSSRISAYAYIALFAALGWCAFPLLGRFDL